MVPKPNIEISIPHLKSCRMIPLTLLIFWNPNDIDHMKDESIHEQVGIVLLRTDLGSYNILPILIIYWLTHYSF